jgi:hypothetical protein
MMTPIQEEIETETGTTMPSQKEEKNNVQFDVEVGIHNGDAVELMGTDEEVTSTAKSETTSSERTKHMSDGSWYTGRMSCCFQRKGFSTRTEPSVVGSASSSIAASTLA